VRSGFLENGPAVSSHPSFSRSRQKFGSAAALHHRHESGGHPLPLEHAHAASLPNPLVAAAGPQRSSQTQQIMIRVSAKHARPRRVTQNGPPPGTTGGPRATTTFPGRRGWQGKGGKREKSRNHQEIHDPFLTLYKSQTARRKTRLALARKQTRNHNPTQRKAPLTLPPLLRLRSPGGRRRRRRGR
jgi:hypothetical protein